MSQPAGLASVLPTFHSAFLGRERELHEIVQLLFDPAVRLVTVAGVGGVGKTRIAVEAAREAAESLDQATVHFVPFAAIGTDQHLLDPIARAMGVGDAADADQLQAIGAALGHGPVLLVLDNLEHLIEQAAQIGRLLSLKSNLTILTTSRAPLEIRGEHVYQLTPFPMPADIQRLSVEQLRDLDAVRLFEERARSVQHDFRVGPANAAAVAAICQRLDGLPLAVELAAARSRLLAPAVLLARLNRPLETLGSGPRDSPDRHQSLRAALDWSYELLTPQEQALFRRLGAPRGSFAIGAVEALTAGIDIDPIEGISSLVGKSLVQPASIMRAAAGEAVRFQMLVTVRDFALEKLVAEGELALAQDLFADYVAAMAQAVMPEFPLGPSDGEFSFDIVGVDREPALAALDWLQSSGQHEGQLRLAVLLAPHWFARGALRDARARLQDALSAAPGGDPDDRLRATVALGMVAIQQGHFDYGEQQLLDALTLARELNSDTWIGQANFSLGVLEQDRGSPDRAIPYFDIAHRTFEAAGNRVFAAITLNNLGLVTARNGNPEAGLGMLDRARQRHVELGFAFGSALADRYAGQILLQNGETERARQRLLASIQLEPEHMQGWHVANTLEMLALLDLREGAYPDAAVLAAGAARLREEIGVPLEPALLGEWHQFLADLRAALTPADLETATAEGRALTLETLIQRAVSPVRPMESPQPAPKLEASPGESSIARLTPREIDVLRLLVDGRSNAEIADELFISPRTVSVHVTHILEKLGVENRSAAVAYVLRSGAMLPNQ